MTEKATDVKVLKDDSEVIALLKQLEGFISETQKNEVTAFKVSFDSSRASMLDLITEMNTVKQGIVADIGTLGTTKTNYNLKIRQTENYTKLATAVLDAHNKIVTMAEKELKTVIDSLNKVRDTLTDPTGEGGFDPVQHLKSISESVAKLANE